MRDEEVEVLRGWLEMVNPNYSLASLCREYIYCDYLTTEEFIALADRLDNDGR